MICNYFVALKNSTRLKRSVPDTVYPEILVIIDHNMYKLFNKDVYRLIPYLLAFWNGVDLKYRNLENPKYRLNIAGIVIAEVCIFFSNNITIFLIIFNSFICLG